jgi:glucokinase
MPLNHLLSFDIGATKTNAALFAGTPEAPFGPGQPAFSGSYINSDFDGPEDIIATALKAVVAPVDIFVLAVAGPVSKQRVTLTNLAWSLDPEGLKKRFDVPHVFLINDLEAIVLGIPYLKPHEIGIVHNRPAVERATVAVIAPGTGLGESFLTWSGDRYTAHPSEGGHCDFAPVDAVQIDLLQFLMKQYDHVSYERICSGAGLVNIYRFLKESAGLKEPAWVADQLAAGGDLARIIVAAANETNRSCDICRRAIALFVSVLGAEAGNLALRALPKGGIYIGGGISPNIVPYFTTGDFTNAFIQKGRMRPLLETIPVSIILNPKIALYGAACHGFQLVA